MASDEHASRCEGQSARGPSKSSGSSHCGSRPHLLRHARQTYGTVWIPPESTRCRVATVARVDPPFPTRGWCRLTPVRPGDAALLGSKPTCSSSSESCACCGFAPDCGRGASSGQRPQSFSADRGGCRGLVRALGVGLAPRMREGPPRRGGLCSCAGLPPRARWPPVAAVSLWAGS
jgi:hypothetical protein